MTYVKTYGTQASGTNYTDKLVKRNFTDAIPLINVLGWKHAPFPTTFNWKGVGWTHRRKLKSEEAPMLKLVTPELKAAAANNEIRWIVVSKHPYANYASNISKNKHKYNYVPVNIDKMPQWIERYNNLYHNWLDAHENIWKYSCLVRYEDYLEDFQKPLQLMSEQLKLEPKEKLSNIRKITRPNHTLAPEMFTAHEWYLNQNYLQFFSRNDIRTFNSHISPRVIEAFGHTLAKPKDFPLDRPAAPC